MGDGVVCVFLIFLIFSSFFSQHKGWLRQPQGFIRPTATACASDPTKATPVTHTYPCRCRLCGGLSGLVWMIGRVAACGCGGRGVGDGCHGRGMQLGRRGISLWNALKLLTLWMLLFTASATALGQVQDCLQSIRAACMS